MILRCGVYFMALPAARFPHRAEMDYNILFCWFVGAEPG